MSFPAMLLRLLVLVCCFSASFARLQDAKESPYDEVVGYDTDQISRCAHENVKVKDATFALNSSYLETGEMFRVVGITSNCRLFYGWLHDVMNKNNMKGKIREMNPGSCSNKYMMLIRSEGVGQQMLLVLDRFGRRVRVQSAFSGYEVGERKDLMWRKLILDRREQFYTAPIERGFSIVTFINANYRIFVVTMNHHTIRIYELRVFVDDDYNLIPYLRDEVMHPSPIVVTPFTGMLARAVHDLDTKATASDDQDDKETGFVFLPYSMVGGNGSVQAPAIPVTSMLTNTFIGVDPSYNYTHITYQEKLGRFVFRTSKECREILSRVMLYHYSSKSKSEIYASSDENKEFHRVTARESAFVFSQRRWFNKKNFHRRMGHPHAVHRMKDREILKKGWKDLAPVFFLTIASIMVISFGVNFLVEHREKKARRLGVSTSYSSNTA